jgi:hypothetical protein
VENIPGHRDHRSDDHDQLIGIIPERLIGMPRNTDRHRPESPARNKNRKPLELGTLSRFAKPLIWKMKAMEGHALKHPLIFLSDAQESCAYLMSDHLA